MRSLRSGGYLLDTSSLSLLAPGRPKLPEAVVVRLRSEAERLYLSTITIAEIRKGVCKLRRQNSSARADAIENWLLILRSQFGNRILAFGMDEADMAGELSDAALGIGQEPRFSDLAIAATAKTNGLVVVTENARHFAPLSAFGVTSLSVSGLV